MAKIYIILPVHNRKEITRRFVDCLKRQTFQNYHLVLVDDGSKDGTAEMVAAAIDSLTVLRGYGDWWWGGSLQKGFEWLRSQQTSSEDIVLLINDDTEFDEDYLKKGWSLINKAKKTLLLSQAYSLHDGRLLDAGVHVDWRSFTHEQASETSGINCLSTRGLYMHVEDFFSTGGFRPSLLPHYGSDYEFTIRAKRLGMNLVTDNSLRINADNLATGSHGVGHEPLWKELKILFSKKSVNNPWYRSVYVALACPWRWKFRNWCRVWYATVLLIGKAAFRK